MSSDKSPSGKDPFKREPHSIRKQYLIRKVVEDSGDEDSQDEDLEDGDSEDSENFEECEVKETDRSVPEPKFHRKQKLCQYPTEDSSSEDDNYSADCEINNTSTLAGSTTVEPRVAFDHLMVVRGHKRMPVPPNGGNPFIRMDPLIKNTKLYKPVTSMGPKKGKRWMNRFRLWASRPDHDYCRRLRRKQEFWKAISDFSLNFKPMVRQIKEGEINMRQEPSSLFVGDSETDSEYHPDLITDNTMPEIKQAALDLYQNTPSPRPRRVMVDRLFYQHKMKITRQEDEALNAQGESSQESPIEEQSDEEISDVVQLVADDDSNKATDPPILRSNSLGLEQVELNDTDVVELSSINEGQQDETAEESPITDPAPQQTEITTVKKLSVKGKSKEQYN